MLKDRNVGGQIIVDFESKLLASEGNLKFGFSDT